MEKDQIKKKEKNLNEILFKFQKTLIISIFVTMILLLIFSFIFFTPFYDAYLLKDATMAARNLSFWTDYIDLDSLPEGTYSKRSGIVLTSFVEFIVNMQDFNQMIFKLGVLGLVLSLFLFIYRAQKRKRYYITNFVSGAIILGFDLSVSLTTLVKLIKNNILVKNFEYWNVINVKLSHDHASYVFDAKGNEVEAIYIEYLNANKVQWVFTVGYIICGIIILICLIGIAYYVYKFIYQRKHQAIDISGVVINE
jgi:hypothetical protein